jgi:hypothetical protein
VDMVIYGPTNERIVFMVRQVMVSSSKEHEEIM